MKLLGKAEPACTALERAGGRVFVVGGAVRDQFIEGQPEPKDIDLLVTGLTFDKLISLLRSFGKSELVGQSFGVVKLKIDNEDFDFALPRTLELWTGNKHRDVQVTLDHTATVEQDLSRRDFTFNAIAIDSQGNLVDLFDGLQDIKHKLIRTVGDPTQRFAEDPLRILRALQFAVRFGFDIETETLKAIRSMLNRLNEVSRERIAEEFSKAWTKGEHQQTFVDLLSSTGVGTFLFGQDFKPVALPDNFQGTKKEKIEANFVACFLQGGNFEAMKPTTSMKECLNIAKLEVSKLPIVRTDRTRIAFVASVLDAIGEKTQSIKLNNILLAPINPKELAVNGLDLIAAGFSGIDIGKQQRHLLSLAQLFLIDNTREAMLKFINNSSKGTEK